MPDNQVDRSGVIQNAEAGNCNRRAPREIVPKDIAPPFGRYAHAVEIAPSARQVVISGQVGVGPDGIIVDGIEAQLEAAWANIINILHSADMTTDNIVKVTTYVTKPEHFQVHPKIRAKMLGDHKAAATGLCVSALAAPEFLCEIEVVAASSAESKCMPVG